MTPRIKHRLEKVFEQSLIPGRSQKCDISHGIDRAKSVVEIYDETGAFFANL
jgi:hypothetical protein